MVQESPRDATAFSLGVAVNIFYTIYDWGKAQLLLKEKQSQICYKYKKWISLDYSPQNSQSSQKTNTKKKLEEIL